MLLILEMDELAIFVLIFLDVLTQLLLVAGLFNQIVSVLVTPHFVHAHSELVVPMSHHCLKMELLYICILFLLILSFLVVHTVILFFCVLFVFKIFLRLFVFKSFIEVFRTHVIEAN